MNETTEQTITFGEQTYIIKPDGKLSAIADSEQKILFPVCFLTIAQEASLGGFSEHGLRVMQKQGILPGRQIGNRFYINHNKLIDVLAGNEGEVAI